MHLVAQVGFQFPDLSLSHKHLRCYNYHSNHIELHPVGLQQCCQGKTLGRRV